MADMDGLYPFGTNNGEAIPLDVVCPRGILLIEFEDGISSDSFLIPEDIYALTVMANQPCSVQFAEADAVASRVTSGSFKEDALFVVPDIHMVVAPPAFKRSIAVVGEDASGTVVFQFLRKWSGMMSRAQIPFR